ncbi:MAG: hypothetical protein GF400_02465 [Candidatus Eisenbacteria bacterium]|nr:hypothetical protein [Candidatus Eisenbacteria bacterium]
MRTEQNTGAHEMRDQEKAPGVRETDRIDGLLEEIEPVDLPPFYRTRLLAKLRDEARRPVWADKLKSPRLAWTVAAVCVAAVVIVATRSTAPPHTERVAVTAPHGAVSRAQSPAGSTIDPVAPADNAVLGAGDVEILAAIYPPVENGSVRLYVDERDVTGLAEVTGDYVMYSPPDRFREGEHIVTIEITDSSGKRVRDVSWLFYTLNGGREPAAESI